MEQAKLGPIAVDVAPYRCPEIDPRVRSAAAQRFPAPPSSRPLGTAHGLDTDAVRGWLDQAEQLDATRLAALRQQIVDYERCRTEAPT